MEWIKITVDRLFGFLTALIPGSAALYLFALHYPHSIKQFWLIGYLGYQTKITISLFSMFLVGWTISTALNSFLGAIGGAIGGLTRMKESEFKPWHDKNWRALLTKYLSDAAPPDIQPISETVLQSELESINQYLDSDERVQRSLDAVMRKNEADLNDFMWSRWWTQFHIMLALDFDPITKMRMSLTHNFQAASIIILCSIPFNPSLNQWWLIAICVFWIVLMVIEGISFLFFIRNPWSTLYRQMAYLEKKLAREHSIINDAN